MEFVHRPYQPNQTIAAIATPRGEGGVAMIRVSGQDAIKSVAKIFTGPLSTYQSHTAHYGTIVNLEGKSIDHVLILVMLGKRSYTGECTVEIHCHGGILIAKRVLETVLETGVRAAQAGEFTLRAYLNGKIDLLQAEAVQELICAKNEYALDVAESQLQGRLSQKIDEFQGSLTEIAAILEAWIDFPEEGLEFCTLPELSLQLQAILTKMQALSQTFHDGKILQEGVTLCLSGCPNVGKSSLMNALLDKERAIVSAIPGTTRDLIDDQLRLNGLNFRLIDTAGLRASTDVIELEGMRRSKEALEKSDIVLLVLDASLGLTKEDQTLLQQVPPNKTIVIWNKCDLPHASLPSLDFKAIVCVSAKKQQGLEQLHQQIDKLIWKTGPPAQDEILLTTLRHKEALDQAILACQQVISGLESHSSPEFLSSDMRTCLAELGTIRGFNITESILSSIFSKFCIGK